MKKRILFILLLFFSFTTLVNAKNKIYEISMSIYLDEYGNADITETWLVKGSDGSEWYKVLNNLGNSGISDFIVSMDGNPLEYKDWNVSESLQEKKGYYGINYTSDGLELCFGKYDYKSHTFTLKYKINNYIINTQDSQVLYWNLIDKLDDVDFQKFDVTVKSYYSFPNTLDVWGYGYKGYAYVNDGIISMSTEEESDMNDKYVVLLVKFPLNTFNTDNTYSKYSTFDDVYKSAEEGTYDYDYDSDTFIDIIFKIFSLILSLLPFIVGVILVLTGSGKKYGYKGNKQINKNNTPYFRDIPCNKDIYYANTLIKLNNFGYNESNILGAIILKWFKEDKISFTKDTKGLFNKEVTVIDLRKLVTFDGLFEKDLFDMMYTASKDGFLEKNEFSNWTRKNYDEFFDVFKNMESYMEDQLTFNRDIYKRKNKRECKQKNVLSDKIYNDSKELYGLKLYLQDFTSINTKEAINVKIWDEYLMFAYLFGIADKVAKQLKNMYPEVIQTQNYDLDTFILINSFSNTAVRSASSARSAAQSYSAGGGGFSSGGGGGGSFGGGGGGSR